MMIDIDKMNREIGDSLIKWIMHNIYEYVNDHEYRFNSDPKDIIALIPRYTHTFMSCVRGVVLDLDLDSFMMLARHKVYFTSPYKNSMVIFDLGYHRPKKLIRLPGHGDEDE